MRNCRGRMQWKKVREYRQRMQCRMLDRTDAKRYHHACTHTVTQAHTHTHACVPYTHLTRCFYCVPVHAFRKDRWRLRTCSVDIILAHSHACSASTPLLLHVCTLQSHLAVCSCVIVHACLHSCMDCMLVSVMCHTCRTQCGRTPCTHPAPVSVG